MSDTPQGDGWWQASDGKFYPPEQHPGAAPPPPTPDPTTQPTQVQPAVTPPDPAATGPGTPTSGAPVDGAPVDPTLADADEDEEAEGNGKRNAIIAIVLLVIAALIAAWFIWGGDDSDDDDVSTEQTEDSEEDIGDATGELVDDGPIEFDTVYNDRLEDTRTEARYTLDAPDGAIMTLTVSNDEASTRGVFAVMEFEGSRFLDMRTQPGATESDVVAIARNEGGEFDLIFTEGPASYTFEVSLELQDDAGDGDAGADFDNASAIDAGQEVSGQLIGTDTTDHFTVDLQPGTRLTLQAAVSRESDRAAFFVVELEGTRLLSERVQPGADTDLALLLSAEDEGIIEVIVTEGPSKYTFTADFDSTSEGGEDGDAPEDLANARTIDPADPLEGRIGDRDGGDYFLFDAPAASVNLTMSVDATSDRAAAVTLEDASGSRVAFLRVEPGASASEVAEVEAGTTLRLIVTEGRADYSITIG